MLPMQAVLSDAATRVNVAKGARNRCEVQVNETNNDAETSTDQPENPEDC